MTKTAFWTAVVGAAIWFGRELWPHIKVVLEDRRIRQRKEQLRLERERPRTTDE